MPPGMQLFYFKPYMIFRRRKQDADHEEKKSKQVGQIKLTPVQLPWRRRSGGITFIPAVKLDFLTQFWHRPLVDIRGTAVFGDFQPDWTSIIH